MIVDRSIISQYAEYVDKKIPPAFTDGIQKVYKGLTADFPFLQKLFLDEIINDFVALNDQEGKFADAIVEIEYSKDHIEQYPYLATFDYEDFDRLKRKYPNARNIRVFNLKYFRDLYFDLIFDCEDIDIDS